MAESSPKSGPSYSSLLKNRSFSYLWIGQLVSQSGDAVFDIALLWLVWVTTQSTALVGLTQAAVLVPAVLVFPFAGVYADRTNRRNLIVLSNVAQGIVTAGVSVLYVLSTLDFSVLIVLVLLLYSCAQFYRAASNAIVPSIVSRENIGAANGLFSLTQSANQLMGYTLGGVIIGVLGLAVPITYDSLTFFAAAFLVLLIAKGHGQARPSGSPDGASSFTKDFREGLSYVRQSRFFLELMFLGVVVNFFATAVFAILAPYSEVWVHGGSSTYGFLSAAFALGTIVGSVLIGKVNLRAYVGKLLFFGVIASGGILILLGLIRSIPPALAAFSAVGVILAVVNVPLNTLFQTKVPKEMLGRAGTVLSASLTAAQPIAAVLSGVLAGIYSIGAVITVSGVAVMVATAVLYFVFKELRNVSY